MFCFQCFFGCIEYSLCCIGRTTDRIHPIQGSCCGWLIGHTLLYPDKRFVQEVIVYRRSIRSCSDPLDDAIFYNHAHSRYIIKVLYSLCSVNVLAVFCRSLRCSYRHLKSGRYQLRPFCLIRPIQIFGKCHGQIRFAWIFRQYKPYIFLFAFCNCFIL